MNSQGLWGAFLQYWTIDEKPRLNRRNSYFEDHKVTNIFALNFYLVVIALAVAMVVFWMVML